MTDRSVLRWLVGGTNEESLYECRDCGLAVGADVDPCPVCGSESIAEYHF